MVGLTGAATPDAQAFADRHQAKYPIYAYAGAQFEALGIRFVPAVFLVGPDGVITADGLGDARKQIEAGLPG